MDVLLITESWCKETNASYLRSPVVDLVDEERMRPCQSTCYMRRVDCVTSWPCDDFDEMTVVF